MQILITTEYYCTGTNRDCTPSENVLISNSKSHIGS